MSVTHLLTPSSRHHNGNGSRLVEESLHAVREARLRYFSDEQPGITRRKHGKNFEYFDPRGRKIHDPDTINRIRALAIPPAWTEVWISPYNNGHIQATGRDDRGRKQYRYHARWRQVRDANKYDRMIDFAKALPLIRKTTAKHLGLPGLPREKVLAAVVRVMEKTLIRVGNEEYARTNRSYGLTTMEDKHARIRGGKVVFEFRGKSGKEHEIDFEDPRLARIVKQCQDLPGEQLFQYRNGDGKVRDINSADVNDYLREITGAEFTAKDFRTWAGTVLAAWALQELGAFDSKKAAKRNIVRAVEKVAMRLGNTTAVCRKCYIHPAVLHAYLDGTLADLLSRKANRELNGPTHLPPEEAAILNLLQHRLAKEATGAAQRN
jgi:DNA topoisomerase-1